MKIKLKHLALAGAICLLGSCANQPLPQINVDAPGFWAGIWHGLVVPFSFIGGLISSVRIYAYPNSGGWYDFGFFIGIGGLSGVGLFHKQLVDSVKNFFGGSRQESSNDEGDLQEAGEQITKQKSPQSETDNQKSPSWFTMTAIASLSIIVLIIMLSYFISSRTSFGMISDTDTIVSLASEYRQGSYANVDRPYIITEDFAALGLLSDNLKTTDRSLCPLGTRSLQSGGCWTLIVDRDNHLNLMFMGLDKLGCLSVGESGRIHDLLRIQKISINKDGSGSLEKAIDLSGLNTNTREALVKVHARNSCRAGSDNQWALTLN